ncbi:MAG: DUF721 domain-containing protein [Puniceicoccales bacterium]|jgi:hypothetical protein|nr:DUF721 domain-containing protein [Puniceicoccales bacterium]
MEFSREINNLIADFRNLPQDESCAIFHREVLMHDALKCLCAMYLKNSLKSMNSNLVANWEQIVGGDYARYCFPSKILPNGMLVVNVSNSVIRSELCFKASEIISRIGKIGCCDRVCSMKFIL